MKNMGCLRIQISIPDPQLTSLPADPVKDMTFTENPASEFKREGEGW